MKPIRIIASLILALCGCGRQTVAPPAVPGPNLDLVYPVVVFSQAGDAIKVRDNARQLTTTTVLESSQGIFDDMQIVDSSNALYAVEGIRSVGKVPTWPVDATGNTPHRIEMRLKFARKVTLDETKQFLLSVIQHPKSYWSQSHNGNGTAVRTVQGAKTFSVLVEACRNTSAWL